MEALLGAVVIAILLFILGFSFQVITFGVAAVILVMTGLTSLAFLYFFVRLMMSKRCEGEFTRIERRDKEKFDRAYYMTDDGELPNAFPCEFVMRDKLYRKGRKVRLRVDRSKKRVYDRNAFMTIITGTVLALIGTAFILAIGKILNLF